ncbi:MAG: Unknown protein [uncultured Thiotrichaceae bacterium]|uniref:histidine kinase n=1 Tax=uncultured Thiotrichaceae bacterium TaxID=298394 RepID=A0A6S6SQ91_9GAMM|nr:MAG: Unknown protein [uncultured Thiotrichaceae bacterium]
MSRLKKKLLLSLLLVAILPSLIIGGYSFYSINKHLRDNSILSLDSKTTLTSQRLTSFLENTSTDISYLRDLSAILLYFSPFDSEEVQRKELLRKNVEMNLVEFIGKKKIYQYARLIGLDGMEEVRITFDGINANTESLDELINAKETRYFSEAIKLQRGETFISRLELNKKNNEIEYPIRPSLHFASPVFDNNAVLRGVVVLSVSVEKLVAIITKQESDNDTMMLIDKEGYYYYHPDESKTWGSPHDLGTEQNLFTEKPLIKDILSQPDKQNYAKAEGDILSYQPIYIGKDRHFIGNLITLASKKEIFSPLISFTWIFATVAFFASLLTFALASILSSSISSPLLKLKEEVKRFSSGDFDSPIDVKTNDEVGDVSHEVEKLRRSMKILMSRYR